MKLLLHPKFLVIYLLLGGFFFLEAAPAQLEIQAPPETRPLILEFSRDQCSMCEHMQKTLEQLKAKYEDRIGVRILQFDLDEKLFKQYNVVIVPTQIFLDSSGREVFRHSGILTLSELTKKLEELKLLQSP